MDDKLLDLLGEAVQDAARLLAERVKEGQASAADITQLRAMFREAGGSLTLSGKPTPAGDDVLESMRDVDPNLFN